jgi:hypothetical protein
LEERRLATGQTLGVLRVSRILELRITAIKETDWTDADWIKLSQDGLFDTVEIKKRPPLRKLPFDFHYRYEYIGPDGKPDEASHKLCVVLYKRAR